MFEFFQRSLTFLKNIRNFLMFMIKECRILLEQSLPLTYGELSPYAIGDALGFDKALTFGFIQINWFFPQ